jgi:hypothetical protein
MSASPGKSPSGQPSGLPVTRRVREREFCIIKAGEVLPVEPKAFQVLLFLLRKMVAFASYDSNAAKTLYYSRFEGGGIWSMPVGGGEERQVTDALHKGYWGHFAVTDAASTCSIPRRLPGPR